MGYANRRANRDGLSGQPKWRSATGMPSASTGGDSTRNTYYTTFQRTTGFDLQHCGLDLLEDIPAVCPGSIKADGQLIGCSFAGSTTGDEPGRLIWLLRWASLVHI